MQPNHPNSKPSDWDAIELELKETETLLTEIKHQLAQAKQVQSDRSTLKTEKLELETQLNHKKLSIKQKQEIKTQLQDLKMRLEAIEIAIAEQLVSWTSFKEPFWQVIRFSGAGFLLGVLFKSFVG